MSKASRPLRDDRHLPKYSLNLLSDGKFPASIKLSEQLVVWDLREVQNWKAERIKSRQPERCSTDEDLR
jgi:hypothetical protein